MLYTILGGIVGGSLTAICCSLAGIDYGRGGYAPSGGELLIFAGTILGLGIGAGFGISALTHGTHAAQILTKKLF